MENEWMNEEEIKQIDQAKLNFLKSLVEESKTLKKDQLLPFFMAVANRAKAQNITLTTQERNLMISAIKKHSSKEELEKINKFLK